MIRHGNKLIHGNEVFSIGASEFLISPLSSPATLYIKGVKDGVEEPKKLADIEAGDYTKVIGAVDLVNYYIETTETFYISW